MGDVILRGPLMSSPYDLRAIELVRGKTQGVVGGHVVKGKSSKVRHFNDIPIHTFHRFATILPSP